MYLFLLKEKCYINYEKFGRYKFWDKMDAQFFFAQMSIFMSIFARKSVTVCLVKSSFKTVLSGVFPTPAPKIAPKINTPKFFTPKFFVVNVCSTIFYICEVFYIYPSFINTRKTFRNKVKLTQDIQYPWTNVQLSSLCSKF